MAERIARTITFPWDWARALRLVAGSLIERSPGRALELLDEVERFVRTNTDPRERATGLCANAVVLVKHDPGRALEPMAEAERLLAPTAAGGGLYGGLFDRYLAVKDALVMMAAFTPAEVERFVRDLVADADPDDRASMVTTVIEDLAEGAPAAAERVARILSGQNLRSFYVDHFVGTLAEQDPDAAERVIRGHDLPATGFAAVAGVLARLDPSRATSLLTEAEHRSRAHRPQRARTALQDPYAGASRRLARLNPATSPAGGRPQWSGARGHGVHIRNAYGFGGVALHTNGEGTALRGSTYETAQPRHSPIRP
jgi:hypothetical protein